MTRPQTDTISPPAPGSNPGDSASGIPRNEITGCILAGGRGRRLSDRDKGLMQFRGRTLVETIADGLRPQVGSLIINANRNLADYARLGYPVVEDILGEFFGPLAGIASVMGQARTDYVLIVPCDSPLLPGDLCERLTHALLDKEADIAVAHDGRRTQRVFALLRRSLLPDLMGYLDEGGRKTGDWYSRHEVAEADFSDRPGAFLNINTPADLEELVAAERRMPTPDRPDRTMIDES